MSLILSALHSTEVVSGLIGAGGTLFVGLARAILQSLQARKLAKEEAFTKALGSDNLEELSTYLRDELGAVSLSTYLRDGEVRNRVDRYFDRLANFVSISRDEVIDPKEITSSNLDKSSEIPIEVGLSPNIEEEPDDPEALKKAIQSVRAGESWNALARLRRDLETIVRSHHPDLPQYQPVTRLVPEAATAEFRLFHSIASRAIHGENVPMQDVVFAIRIARTLYKFFDKWFERDDVPPRQSGPNPRVGPPSGS